MRILSGFQDTRSNAEDFALTPYLFSVINRGGEYKVYGLGLCWGFYALFIALGSNIPKGFPYFISCTKNRKMKETINIKRL